MEHPQPPAAIPDFLLEQLTDLSPETLRDVGEYARETSGVAPESVPQSIITAFALQDDETLDAIARYAESLAAFLEERDAESLAAIMKDRSTDGNGNGNGNRNEDEEKWGHDQLLQWYG